MKHELEKYGAHWRLATSRLEGLGQWLAPLGLRLILAWEFGEAGLEKLRGSNWFGHVQESFPFPFSVISAEVSWFMATWFEILGAAALLLGICTRFFAFSLLVLTFVATAAVHWPETWSTLGELWQGYAITDRGAGNFKLPLLFALMLLPLVLNGAGRFSLDNLVARAVLPEAFPARTDGPAWALAGIVFGVLLFSLFPAAGISLAAAGVIGLVALRLRGAHAGGAIRQALQERR